MNAAAAAAYKVDKTGWGDGPWMTEPDRVDWIHAGYACLLLRQPWQGHWCGYVAIDRAHPLYGVNFKSRRVRKYDFVRDLTYSKRCDGVHVCHVPAEGMPDDVWWLGFDCMGSRECAPAFEARQRELDARIPELSAMRDESEAQLAKCSPEFQALFKLHYCDVAEVEQMTNQLAEELRDVATCALSGSKPATECIDLHCAR